MMRWVEFVGPTWIDGGMTEVKLDVNSMNVLTFLCSPFLGNFNTFAGNCESAPCRNHQNRGK